MDKTAETKVLLKKTLDPQDGPSRVPLFLNLQGWIVYHKAGFGYTESVFNSDKLLAAYEKAMNDYPADLYYDTGGYAFMGFSKLLGSEDFYLNDEKYSLNFKDISYISDDSDLKALAANPQKFLWNHFYNVKFKSLSGEKFKETIRNYLELTETHYSKAAELKGKIEAKNGSLFLSDVPMYQPAFDYLFQYIIGMKGISLAMRRKKELLHDALDSFEALFTNYMDVITPALSTDMPFQNQVCLLGQTITNRMQFEQYIWNHLGPRLEKFSENGYRFYFMVEGSGGVLLDYIDKIPDGSCALHIEKDSLEYLSSRFGRKFTYVGGMPVEMLGNASMEECRKYARQLLEKYGHAGNYIFSTDKGIVFEADAKPDNLKAVCEEVLSFRV